MESKKDTDLNVEIVTREPITVIGLPIDCSSEPDDKSIFKDLWERFADKKLPPTEITFGVCMWTMKQMLSKEMTYIAAIPLDVWNTFPAKVREKHTGEFRQKNLPGGLYAKVVHKGPTNDIDKTYTAYWGGWLPQSKYRPRTSCFYERYDERWKPDSKNSEIDLYFPIAPSPLLKAISRLFKKKNT